MNAYSIIADILKLRNTKDNIYVGQDGGRYYLDRFGFHSVNQFDNQTINDVIKENNKLRLRISDIDTMIERENAKINNEQKILLGKKHKKTILSLINSRILNDKQKLHNIEHYLKIK